MDRPTTGSPVLDAAHVIARGGELDRKLDALAGHALSIWGGQAAVVYVLDPLAASLVPAAAAGVDLEAIGEAGAIPLADLEAVAVRAVRERRTATGDGASPGAAPALPSARSVVAIPLIYADEAGTEEAEGALVVTHDGQPAAGSAAPEMTAIADLGAVAIRQARLERTLLERAEWISRIASTDALTGLPNRTSFERMLELELARSSRQQVELSVVLFDVDGLAAINREHGAEVGDDVLRATASLLAEQVRLVDGVARIGPDEFGLVAPSGGGAVVARRIRDAAARISAASAAVLSLSSAVVVFPHDGATVSELMARASEILADARRQGPGTVVATREWAG